MTAFLDSNPLRSTRGESEIVSGRFKGAYNSATKMAGKGWTLSQGSGAGIYVVTLDKDYYGAGGGGWGIMSASKLVAIAAYTHTSGVWTVTFTVCTMNTGTATDLGASDELWFNLEMVKSAAG